MWEGLFDQLCRRVIRQGILEIEKHDGRILRLGDGTGKPVTMRLTEKGLYKRFVTNPELAMGESYTEATMTIDNNDLHGLLALVIKNLQSASLPFWRKPFERFLHAMRRLAQFNPVGKAQANVAHHYDLSEKLYDLFLDADRQYSCAYFTSPDATLEQAQIAKKHHIAGKLLIEPGMEVLDIGCGWGGMALTLARDYGARVTGVTLSEEQHKLACQRVADAGLQDRIDIRLQDYRELTGQYDKLVSIEMIEAVGHEYYEGYFEEPFEE